MNKLALKGGKPIRTKLFPRQISIGREEKRAVGRVMSSKKLSAFRGSWNENFYGGEEIQAFEQEICKKFNVKHAISVNSCTSALQISCGAVGINPGDEVIVSPYTMTCSATAPMIYGGVPVFADVEKDYYCLDIEDIERKITDNTKAIIVVDIFGQPFNERICNLVRSKGISLIEDAAQAIGSKCGPEYAGTIGDLGCFSFTQGKHLTSGEGGVIVTNNDDLAFKCQLLRNHAESVLNDMDGYRGLNSLVGFNMRMTELQAAIMREQLKKLDKFIEERNYNVRRINELLSGISFLSPSRIRDHCTHSYYVQSWKYHEEIAGVHRDIFVEAVKSELAEEQGRPDKGVPIGCGYIKPLYRMPLFDETLKGFSLDIVEKLWKDELIITTLQQLPLSQGDINDIVNAFYKVAENLGQLK